MDAAALSLAARIVLATILVVAAVSKVRSGAGTRDRAVSLLGRRMGPVVARALPVVEIGVAISLVSWWGVLPGALATALLLAFTAVVVWARLRHVPCPCFGSAAGDAPPGAAAVLRNAVFVVYAILATGSPSGAGLVATFLATVGLGVLAVLVVGFGR